MRPVFVNPESLGAPKGYSNGVLFAPGGALLFVAGQIGWDGEGRFEEGFVAQFDRAMANILTVVREAGGSAESIGRLTMYVTDKELYRAAIRDVGASYRRHMGKHFPAMALVEVKGLLEDRALVEIEATAVVPAQNEGEGR